ncbi:MAG: GNAT family N-acetyltransferase [Micavibrio sp.]
MRIRLATREDIPALKIVEESAAKAFIGSSIGYVPANTVDPGLLLQLADNGTLWVAVEDDNVPIGFAACYPLDGFLYLHEISVSKDHQRKGIGRRLMQVIEDYALDERYPYIGLTTFRDIRWNGPFYKSIGYEEIPPELYTGLRNKYEEEIRNGHDPELRCIMIKVMKD